MPLNRLLHARRGLALGLPAIVLAAFALAGALGAGACDGEGGSSATGAAGGGGEGGCPITPVPMLTISVRAQDGPVPLDTRLRVTWSAGEEPLFSLDDPTTWKTLDEANVVCAVDPTMPPPGDLASLDCSLWTSGATKVEVTANGYVDFDETLSPTPSDVCEGFVPKHVDIQLVREQDGGAE